MAEKTFKEKFSDWFTEQVSRGLKNFQPTFDYEAIAEKFGAQIHYDAYGLFSYIDFSVTPYETIMHPEIQEYIYKGLYEFVTAPSIRIKDTTNEFGEVQDPHHPDWTSDENKIEHITLIRKIRTDGEDITSRYEIPAVIQGLIEPEDGLAVEDYKAQWIKKVSAWEERTGKSWPHPRKDPYD